MTDLAAIEARIREAMARARRAGFQIRSGSYFHPPTQGCCPLGAWLLTTDRVAAALDANCLLVSRALGLPLAFVTSFASGFDGDEGSPDLPGSWDPDAYALGQKFRQEWLAERAEGDE